MNEDRVVDELVARHVFGWACAHDMRPVPEALKLADARALYTERYGQSPPPNWKPEQHDPHCYCNGIISTERFEGMWCVKCGLRSKDLGDQHLGYWSRNLSYGWRVVEQMRELGKRGWMPGGMENMSEEQVSRAICLAALRALGVKVPA